jgi:membrane-associated HD superfamily phosphohydrolase
MDFVAGIEPHSTMDSPSSSSRRRKGKRQQQQQQQKSTSKIDKKLEEKEHLLALKKTQQELLRQETAKIVLWRQPINTIHYCFLEIIYLIHYNFKHLISYRKTLFLSSIFLLFILFIYKTEGSHQKSIQTIESLFFFDIILVWSWYSIIHWIRYRFTYIFTLSWSIYCSSDISCI